MLHTLKMKVKPVIEKIITFAVRLARIDLQILAYNNRGILRSGDYVVSGEKFFLERILALCMPAHKQLFFDVGANVGDYSLLLASIFPSADIHSFEPNPHAFKLLKEKSAGKKIHPVPLGLSSSASQSELSLDPNFLTSGWTSMYGDRLNDMAVYETNLSKKEKITLTTIDAYVAEKKITHIDFLKIDIEGNELEALRGATKSLDVHGIGMIQFEFNVANIAARVFMKDFYDLLKDFHFYRIKKNGLLPLGPYSPQNEIYRIQNILAVSRHTHPEAEFKGLLGKRGMLFDIYGRHI